MNFRGFAAGFCHILGCASQIGMRITEPKVDGLQLLKRYNVNIARVLHYA